MLEFSHVTKTFRGPDGDVSALNDVTFSIKAGELVAVQGSSGCGKTTMLLVAGGLLRPSSGEVLIGDQKPYDVGVGQRTALRAELIGFVFQQFHLIPYLTVLDNILAPTVAKPDPEARARAGELIRRFQLEHRVGHVPAQLSTGECQRTALARALLNQPKLILADEPTGNLDETNGKIVLDHLTTFARNGGAVLLVTHDSRIAQLADRIMMLDQGKVVGEISD